MRVLGGFLCAFLIGAVAGVEVTTTVASDKPYVTITCELPLASTLSACRLRSPSGQEYSANTDRYDITIQPGTTSQKCVFQITDPLVEDLGIWRCALVTSAETYFGFAAALCPWAMSNPEVAAAVIAEPTLVAEMAVVTTVEEREVTLSCYAHTAIRYCYFRSRNGSIFVPGSQDGVEYVGSGLAAGECSARFPRLFATDSGSWSCHVGFSDPTEPEQRSAIQLSVEALLAADQFHIENNQNTLVVQAQAHSQSSLEYCRFVRMDGHGFTSENLPSGYENHSLLNSGRCEIRIHNPSILEQHPWAVAVRISGEANEIVRSTQHTITIPDDYHENPDVEDGIPHPGCDSSRGAGFWVFKILVGLVIIGAFFIIGWFIGTRRNSSCSFRESIRNSFKKKPVLPEYEVTAPKTTESSMAA